MDKVGSKMRIFSLHSDFEEMDYALGWQYLVSYVNALISNLELFKKVVYEIVTYDELKKWYSTFYGKLKNNDSDNLDMIFSISDDERMRDYNLYKDFVLHELEKYEPFLTMHLSSAREAVSSISMAEKRLLRTLNERDE